MNYSSWHNSPWSVYGEEINGKFYLFINGSKYSHMKLLDENDALVKRYRNEKYNHKPRYTDPEISNLKNYINLFLKHFN